jgi:hypothetical protein
MVYAESIKDAQSPSKATQSGTLLVRFSAEAVRLAGRVGPCATMPPTWG